MFDEVTCLFLTLVLSKQNIYHSMTTHKPMLHPATTTDVLMLTYIIPQQYIPTLYPATTTKNM